MAPDVRPVQPPRRDANDAGRAEWEVTTVVVQADTVSLIADGWEPLGVVPTAHDNTVRVLLRRRRGNR